MAHHFGIWAAKFFIFTCLFLTPALVNSAQYSNVETDLQDAREFARAMTFVKSRGLDISKGIKSKGGWWRIVIEEGTGIRVSSVDTANLHLTGWLADGTKLWSSHDGEDMPITIRVNGYLAGVTEALKTMKVGGKTLVVFPGSMGYGKRSYPEANIHPNATLVFEIELISMGW